MKKESDNSNNNFSSRTDSAMKLSIDKNKPKKDCSIWNTRWKPSQKIEIQSKPSNFPSKNPPKPKEPKKRK